MFNIKKKKKILCLHGGGDSSSNFKKKKSIQYLIDELTEFEFVFPNLLLDNGMWWNEQIENSSPLNIDHAKKSINNLDKYIQDNGPFNSILGFSQGASMILIYLVFTNNVFDKVILCNGYLPINHQGLMNILSDKIFDTEAIIFMGDQDFLFKEESIKIKNYFKNYKELTSKTAGHHPPYKNDPIFDEFIDCIRNNISVEIKKTETKSEEIIYGPENQWRPYINNWENNSIMYVKVKIDGIYKTTGELCAFVDITNDIICSCCYNQNYNNYEGVTRKLYKNFSSNPNISRGYSQISLSPFNEYIFTLIIYSNEDNENISFIYYDGENEYLLKENYQFQNNEKVGSLDNPFELTAYNLNIINNLNNFSYIQNKIFTESQEKYKLKSTAEQVDIGLFTVIYGGDDLSWSDILKYKVTECLNEFNEIITELALYDN